MARSKYIYMVHRVGTDTELPWAFTVKHEAIRAIANSTIKNKDLDLARVLDAALIGLGDDEAVILDIEKELAASGYIKTTKKEG